MKSRQNGNTRSRTMILLITLGILTAIFPVAEGHAQNLDFGDAPDPTYPTQAASSHVLDGATYLGSCVDSDGDGQPSANADGDDANIGAVTFGTCVAAGDDDEDGVTFGIMVAGRTAIVDVVASGTGNLSAWIDWNADGDWDDVDEHVFSDEVPATGTNTLSVAVPAGATVGQTYARFRFSTDTALSYSGPASDGEVEDYMVSIIGCGNTPIVGNANDSGPGSLRQAIAEACPGATITFDGDYSIYLDSVLTIDQELTIDGSGHSVVVSGDSGNNGTSDVRVFTIGPNGVVTLDNLTISDGTADEGGGIYNDGGTLTLTGCTLLDNSAVTAGGGISNVYGTLAVNSSTFSGNSTGPGPGSGFGGGMDNYYGTVVMAGITFSGNSAHYGGGISNVNSNLTMTNSTLSGNSAEWGGGIYNSVGMVTVINSTLSDNSANTSGGGIENYSILDLTNTIVANSTSGNDCYSSTSLSTNVRNLIEDGSCGSEYSGDPLLGPLQDNGGPALTHALLAGSPALNAGDTAAAQAAGLTNDHRGSGFARFGYVLVDIGAYELQTGELPLVVTIDQAGISENGGTGSATVSRSPIASGAATVTLASDETGEATVPATVTIADGSDSATFDITAVDDAVVDGTQTVTITADATDYIAGTDTVEVIDDETLTLALAIAPAGMSENGGSATGTVSRNAGDVSAALTVSISSNDTGEATVPAGVTIPAGQSSATFTIVAVDDVLADGTQTATITAGATGYADGTDTVQVTDDETFTLTLAIAPAGMSENGGSATGTVSRNAENVSAALSVSLNSGDTGEATVPAGVTIPAGQSSATFDITAVDDATVDGTITVTITAGAAGYAGGTDTIDVTDDDTLTLTLAIAPAGMSENGGSATGTVSRNAEDVSAALTVSLNNNDTGEATVPASVNIPAGQSSATFTIYAVDDVVVDGTQTVTITADATGYTAGTDTIDVINDDTFSPTLSDAVQILKILTSVDTTSDFIDVNNNDQADMGDVIGIMQYVGEIR